MMSLLPAGSRKIDWDDYAWFSKFLAELPPSVDSMAHSGAYLLHTGRNGLFLVEHRGQTAFVAVHPNIECAALVLPAGAHFAPELWSHLCSSIASAGLNVTLGRITPDFSMQMEKIDFFRATTEKTLDWRYPVTILDVAKLSEMRGSSYRGYRKKVNRANRDVPIEIADQRSPIYFERYAAVVHMIEKWADAVSSIKNFDTKHLVSSNLAAYHMGMRQIEGLSCKIYYAGNSVIGFSAVEVPQNGGIANGIARCLDRSWIGCSEYMYWNDAKILSDSGYGLYNINGSETKSLDEFRSKLRPYRKINLQTFLWIEA
ncbi:phosphatidylglycerol lysyltransferase domain-containing protein [Rhodovulum kholense]|uniref:Phosphatidylglycerol lysyltransferase C-terminal domain-containing protein n=1 Tax=Rhodovulum kholense TaxID=453584 RepID=A0A8E3ANT3_9RHOB|nr:phosphatidylglycerol lysyltransferase domain-containing protein [Rhodovulum kholense]PTW39747.1 hypothetical protein C8N38_1268 [Rhodovulum kholense]